MIRVELLAELLVELLDELDELDGLNLLEVLERVGALERLAEGCGDGIEREAVGRGVERLGAGRAAGVGRALGVEPRELCPDPLWAALASALRNPMERTARKRQRAV